MALAKKRKSEPAQAPVTTAVAKKRGPSPVWLAPLMLAMFGLGLLWIVVYYLTQGDMPLIGDIGGVGLLVGFGFIIVGFGLATQWR